MNRIYTYPCALVFAIALSNAAMAQTEPYAGQWNTWVIRSGSSLRLPAPPDEYASRAELDQVQAWTSQVTPDIRNQIAYWNAGAPSYRWMQLAEQEALSHNLGAPLATRALALVAAAMHDATVATWDSKYAFNRLRPSLLDPAVQTIVSAPDTPSYPSEYAATATAAAAVLAYIFPDDATNIDNLAQQAINSRLYAGTEFPSDSQGGMQLGQAVGAAVVAYGRADGSDAVFTGSFPAAPGKWGNANPAQPLAGTWKPWVLTSASEFRLPAPAAVGSPELTAQVALVENLNRTTAVQQTAWFWQPSFYGPWLDALNQALFESGLMQDPPRAARAYALTAIAQHDSTLACWDTKYTYLEPRPPIVDSNFMSLFPLPAHPSFPSGHACASGGFGQVMGYLFPSQAAASAAKAVQAGESTFYAGVHFQSDVDAGLALGKQVGQAVISVAQQDGSQ